MVQLQYLILQTKKVLKVKKFKKINNKIKNKITIKKKSNLHLILNLIELKKQKLKIIGQIK